VRASTQVKAIRKGEVELASGEVIYAANILWAAAFLPSLSQKS